MASHAPHVQVPAVLKRRKCFIHIDLEQIRLGLTADVPLVSQQWNAIIAVNYAARKFGITRLKHNVFDAKQLCPDLVCAHVATLGPGDSQPDYYPSPSRYTHKVSLDPYRKASAKIFSVFRRFNVRFQKGGLDEVFMDVTDLVNQRIMDEYRSDLSKWDRDSAKMIDWRDHPEAGVIFGMDREGDNDQEFDAITTFLYDNDEDEDQKTELDDVQAEESDEGLDSEDENAQLFKLEDKNEYNTESKQLQHANVDDDFDLDFEEVLDSDIDISFSQHSQQVVDLENKSHELFLRAENISDGQQKFNISDKNEQLSANEGIADEVNSEEQVIAEKRAEEEKLRLEFEQLRLYYGIPEGTFEEEFWAEMQLLKAAEFCREVRMTVKEELGYTCSAGIGNNRLLAKVGSGMNKPFNQTVVLPKYIPKLLHRLKLNKIRNLGGKFGKLVREDYNIERASQLWPVPLRQLQQRYGEQAGLELWQWCRGIDHGGIRKTKSKSMCSHKSFIPALSDLEEIQFWITSMSMELVSRMQAEYDETERWPRTVSLGFYGGTRTRQTQMDSEYKSTSRALHKGTRSMPLGGRFDYGGVEGIARKMYTTLERLIKEAETGKGRHILPLVLLTITVSNFTDGGESAMGDITKFFSKAPSQIQRIPQQMSSSSYVKNEDMEATCELVEEENESISTERDYGHSPTKPPEPTEARRRFFQLKTAITTPSDDVIRTRSSSPEQSISCPPSPTPERPSSLSAYQGQGKTETIAIIPAATSMCYQCPSPGQLIPIEEWEQHNDYHFALSLLEDDKKQHQVERQQQQASRIHDDHQESNKSGKRNVGASPSASSARGKRKRTAVPSVTTLTKFFKPLSS
ncbi:DNA-directed DNA polymerase eta rad30 [Lobosporangium transversale]|uniref:DNA polymerase eta n=1 Tax=Lobosporangium transversale TaxID=64571 RepID=A0A1Y2GMV7_9FUNG|nr:hypothetical protein BCR41DRAFT_422584 [Lobosporangium transversale]KAF9917319.1 DNA-directed DNA polymerase eta rad30 [Lobosporangium transversale]ORZ14344.1 hypothetical protein BCR41DRAFT_422584 [Lobosporangium transversale]|eukprot:XP_021880822.1 hypothetical protein BCR41DRAFT_422584 [Lobosporangium transversale]